MSNEQKNEQQTATANGDAEHAKAQNEAAEV